MVGNTFSSILALAKDLNIGTPRAGSLFTAHVLYLTEVMILL